MRITSVFILALILPAAVPATKAANPAAAADPNGLPPAPSVTGLEFIDTSFENASPLWYDFAADGTIQIHLLYDHERSSPNRAAGHFHFLLWGKTGSKLTLEFKNLDNVWNGTPGSVAKELKVAVVSRDGRHWQPVPTESLPQNRVRLTVEMPGPKLHVAREEPYRLSDLDRLLASIRPNPRVQITPIGRTVQGRELEIVRVGDPQAPYRVFVRARAHPWEAGGNWVVEGLLHRLLQGDDDADKFLRRYCVYVLPMANKDGVACGRTRFNLLGKDLNRDWDKPADPKLAPENYALERWLEKMIQTGQRPQLALELHNDGSGLLHISRPPVPQLPRYLERMAILESLLRQNTWFTEGSTKPSFRNAGTLGDGWLERYGIDAAVHEFNCNWIAGLKDYPSARHWQTYGEELADVFYEYFGRVYQGQ
jgi:Zinc carboxypeptidase